MDLREIEGKYKMLLRPVFGDRFRIEHDRKDFVTVFLDGDREEFFFTIYGLEHVRLYWCNECFIFDGMRNELVSSDTFGEIVFEGRVEARTLPEMVAALVLQLKDCVFFGKSERLRGKTPSGFDDVKDYVIQVETDDPGRECFRLENILIVYR